MTRAWAIAAALSLVAGAAVAQTPEQRETARQIIADVGRLQGEYKACLTEKTVTLGAKNAESAETVLRAVSSACLPVETSLRDAYDRARLPTGQVEFLMARDRKLGEDAGVAALLAARSRP